MIVTCLFCFGFFIGNISNKVSDYYAQRCQRRKSYWKGCEHCQHPYTLVDYIPIIVYVLYFGKCRHCHHKISIRYPLVELAFASLVLLSFRMESGLLAVSITCFLWVLLMMALIDAYTLHVPMLKLVLFVLCSIALSLSDASIEWMDRIFAMFLFSIPVGILACTKKRSIGSADIFYLLIAGYGLGLWGILFSSVIAYFLAFLYGMYLLMRKKKKKDHAIAMFPFFFLGCLMYFLFAYQYVVISIV